MHVGAAAIADGLMAGNVLCPGLLISFRVFFTVFYLLVCYFFFLNHIVSLVPGECKLHENLHFVIVYCGSLGWYGEEGGDANDRTNLCS